MEAGMIAEASSCCPSPVFGQLLIAAYIVCGAFVYLWLFSMVVRWARARYRRQGSVPETNLQ